MSKIYDAFSLNTLSVYIAASETFKVEDTGFMYIHKQKLVFIYYFSFLLCVAFVNVARVKETNNMNFEDFSKLREMKRVL